MSGKKGINVCVLMGGTSSEREVSLRSGQNVYEALARTGDKYNPIRGELDRKEDLLDIVKDKDLVFNCLHGGIGEDGTVQSLLEMINVPYTGTGPLGSAVAINKLHSKKGFNRASVNTPDYLEMDYGSVEDIVSTVSDELGFPVVVKPVDEGSSRGVKIVDDEPELRETLESLREDYGDLFLEEYISGKELTAGILREDGELRALPLIEIDVKKERFFNYKAKYTPGETEFIIPARLSENVKNEVKEQALRTHREFGCQGYSRVDFMIDEQKGILGLEVNTLPGMTETSDLPQAAKAAGMDFEELVKNMADSALSTG